MTNPKWLDITLTISILILGLGALVFLNLMWLLGYNGEIRTTAIALDVTLAAMLLNFIRNKLGILASSE